MAADPALARIAGDWADRLSRLDVATPAEEPPAMSGARSRRGSAPSRRRSPSAWRRWFDSLVFWRGLGLAASRGDGGAGALSRTRSAGRAPTPAVVAVLAGHGGEAGLGRDRRAEIGRGQLFRGRAASRGQAATLSSCGASPAGRRARSACCRSDPAASSLLRAARLPAPGDVLAVSLEPPGGSPTGLANRAGPLSGQDPDPRTLSPPRDSQRDNFHFTLHPGPPPLRSGGETT